RWHTSRFAYCKRLTIKQLCCLACVPPSAQTDAAPKSARSPKEFRQSCSAAPARTSGGYTTATNKSKKTTALNLATPGRFDLADVDLQAAISIVNTGGRFASLAACYSGSRALNISGSPAGRQAAR